MDAEHCPIEREGPVRVVTSNRPEANNALSGGLLAGMDRHVSAPRTIFEVRSGEV